jgi:hypothetical protein
MLDSNEVVTARMSNSGKCIILGVKIHGATISIGKFRFKSGAGAVGVACGLDTPGIGGIHR